MPSLHDGMDDPVPGLPLFGVMAHLEIKPPYYSGSQADADNYPPCRDTLDPYPVLRRYIDAHHLVPMSEFTIVDIASTFAVFHLLATDSGGKIEYLR